MKSLKNYLVFKWDNLIYKLAYPSFNRILKRSPGICYLFLLHLESWIQKKPLAPELRQATKEFFEELNEYTERTKEL